MSKNTDRKVIHNIRTEVDSFGRKKYKLEEVAQQDSEQEENQNKAIVDTGRHKSMLIGRQEGLNIQKYIGKIETNKKKKATEVFYCDVCSEGFKCDMAYLTHINGPAHNRKLGMNMKVKNVSLETVSSKIDALISKKQQKQQEKDERKIIKKIEEGYDGAKRTEKYTKPYLPQKENEIQRQNDEDHDDEDEDDENQHVKQEAQQKEQEQEQNEKDNSNQLAEMQMIKQMGFANSFGTKKHKR